jgi:hypothetical protein
MCHVYAVMVLTFTLALTSCRDTASGSQTQRGIQRANDDSAGQWQRMKECSAQVDRAIKMREANKVGDHIILESENHYNREGNRCYVKVKYMVPEAPRTNLPMSYIALLDAFESRLVAATTDDRTAPAAPGFCHIDLTPEKTNVAGDCDKSDKFIDDQVSH